VTVETEHTMESSSSVLIRLSNSSGSFGSVRNRLRMWFEFGVFGSGSVRFPSLVYRLWASRSHPYVSTPTVQALYVLLSAFVALANLRYINALNSNNNTYTEPSPSQTDLRTAVVVVDRRNFCAERHYQTCTDCANKTSPSVVPRTTDHCTLYIRGPLYILCCEFSRRKLSPTLASAHYSCPDNAIALVIGADFHRAVVATAPGEKLLIGRSLMRNWTQLHIFLCFTGSQ